MTKFLQQHKFENLSTFLTIRFKTFWASLYKISWEIFHSATNWKVLVSWRKQEEKINISCCQFYYFMIFIFFIPNRCGPCHAIAPKLDELSQKYVIVNFLKVDVDRCMVSQYFHLKRSNQFDVFHNFIIS